jgi:hypothetical protein
MRKLITILLLLPFFAFSQINDNWDAVKVGTTDMSKIYVGSTLVWQKQVLPYYLDNGPMRYISSSSTLELPMPNSVEDNQVAVAVITLIKSGTSTGEISTPTGWTRVAEYSVSTQYNALFAKSLDGGESASYNFTQTFSNFTEMWGAIFTYANATNFSGGGTSFYQNSTGFTSLPTIANERLGVNFCSIRIGETISISGDLSTDAILGGSGYGMTISATSLIGDGSQKTVTYSWTTQVPYASTYVGLEIY